MVFNVKKPSVSGALCKSSLSTLYNSHSNLLQPHSYLRLIRPCSTHRTQGKSFVFIHHLGFTTLAFFIFSGFLEMALWILEIRHLGCCFNWSFLLFSHPIALLRWFPHRSVHLFFIVGQIIELYPSVCGLLCWNPWSSLVFLWWLLKS